jgi:hypothetical protein
VNRLLLAAIVAFGGAGSSWWQQAPVFSVRADAVVVDVSVRDGRRLVTGLAEPDFELLDNGVRQTVVSATRGQVPLEVTLIVDVSNSMGTPDLGFFVRAESSGESWLAEGIRAMRELLTAADRLEIIAAASRIRRVEPVDGRWRVGPPGDDEKSGHSSLFDAVVASAILPTEPGRRRLVLVLTDGLDTTSAVPLAGRSDVLDRSDSVVLFLVLGKRPGLGGPAIGTNCNPQNLVSDVSLTKVICGERAWLFRDLAARTGGRVAFSVTERDFVPAFREIFEEFRSRYVLTYVPTAVPAPGWHRIHVVVVGHKNYEVVARLGYWRD